MFTFETIVNLINIQLFKNIQGTIFCLTLLSICLSFSLSLFVVQTFLFVLLFCLLLVLVSFHMVYMDCDFRWGGAK